MKLIMLSILFSLNLMAQNNVNPRVLMETTSGDIELELFAKKAPISVENFLSYVKSGHYKGTIFHRIIKDFMIQGGGMDEKMAEKKTNPPIKNEANNGLSNDKGTIAMARTGEIHSATSQFFINVEDNSRLDYKNDSSFGYGYAVFGKVTKGMDIVNKIRMSQTASKAGHDDVPVNQIVIKNMTIK